MTFRTAFSVTENLRETVLMPQSVSSIIRFLLLALALVAVATTADAQSTVANEWGLVGRQPKRKRGRHRVRDIGRAFANEYARHSILAQSWKDTSGNLWFFGGWGFNLRNDIWEYSLATSQWTWMGGTNQQMRPGFMALRGQRAISNIPGAREEGGGGRGWVDTQAAYGFLAGLGTIPRV